jgi:hypothetical protein
VHQDISSSKNWEPTKVAALVSFSDAPSSSALRFDSSSLSSGKVKRTVLEEIGVGLARDSRGGKGTSTTVEIRRKEGGPDAASATEKNARWRQVQEPQMEVQSLQRRGHRRVELSHPILRKKGLEAQGWPC